MTFNDIIVFAMFWHIELTSRVFHNPATLETVQTMVAPSSNGPVVFPWQVMNKPLSVANAQ